jgi:hypothetical protein
VKAATSRMPAYSSSCANEAGELARKRVWQARGPRTSLNASLVVLEPQDWQILQTRSLSPLREQGNACRNVNPTPASQHHCFPPRIHNGVQSLSSSRV